MSQTTWGWQTAVLAALRLGGVAVLVGAGIRQQRTVETIDAVVRDETAMLAYERTAAVEAGANSAVNMVEPPR